MDKTGKLMINSGTKILPHNTQELVKEKNKKSQSEKTNSQIYHQTLANIYNTISSGNKDILTMMYGSVLHTNPYLCSQNYPEGRYNW